MPDQVELRVDVITSGKEQLESIATSMRALEEVTTSGTASLGERVAAEKALTELLEQRKAILATVAAAEKSLAEQHEALNASTSRVTEAFKEFGESVHERITEPLGYSYFSVGKLAESFGTLGSAASIGVGAIAGLGFAAFDSAKSLGELGTHLNSVAAQTGLTTQEVSQFGFAAKASGADIGSFEMAMKMLSRALTDSSEEGNKAKTALHDHGIEARDLQGALKPMSQIFMEISAAMNEMTSTADRNTFAQDVLGRSGLDLVPTLMKLRENLNLANQAGIETFSPAQVAQMEEYHKKVLLIEDSWDRVWHAIQRAAVEAASFVLRGGVDVHAQGTPVPGYTVDWSSGKAQMVPQASADLSESVRNFIFQKPSDLQQQIGVAQGRALIAASQAGMNSTKEGADILLEKAKADEKTARDKYFALDGAPVAQVSAAKKDWDNATANLAKQQGAVDALDASKKFPEMLSTMQNKTENDVGRIENELAVALKTPGLSGDALRGTGQKGELRAAALDAIAEALQKGRDEGITQQEQIGDLTPSQRLSNAGRMLGPFGMGIIPTGLRPTNFLPPGSDMQRMLNEGAKMSAQPMEEQYAGVKRADEQVLKFGKEFGEGNTDVENIRLQTQREGIQREAARAQQVSQLSVPLGSGAQGQEQAINDAYTIRLKLAEQLRDIDLDRASKVVELGKQTADTAKANADYIKESEDAQLDRQMKLLELAQKQKEEARSLSGGLFDALTTHDPSKAVKDFFIGQAKGVGSSVFSNVTAPFFEPIGGAIDQMKAVGSGIGPRTFGGLTTGPTLAQAGLPSNFGIPGAAVSSPHTQIVATDANTAALVRLTAVLSSGGRAIPGGGGGTFGGGGGGLTYGGTGAGISLAGDFSADYSAMTGVSSSGDMIPDIFIPGTPSYGGSAASPAMAQATAQSRAVAASASPAAMAQSAINVVQTGMKGISDGLTKIAPSLANFGKGAATLGSGEAIPTLFGSTANGAQGGTISGQIGAGVGLAGATYTGVTTALRDFQKGGVGGISGGVGSLAQTAANFDPEPISHAVLQTVALVSDLVSVIAGNPKAERQNQINQELQNASYNSTGYIDEHGNYVPGAENKSIQYFGASGGQSYDTNFMGGYRGGSYASTSRNTYDPSAGANQLRNGTLNPPPGYSFDNAIGYGNQAPGSTGINQPGNAANTTIVVQTMDAKSFLDNSDKIASAMYKSIQQGHPVVGQIQQVANPR